MIDQKAELWTALIMVVLVKTVDRHSVLVVWSRTLVSEPRDWELGVVAVREVILCYHLVQGLLLRSDIFSCFVLYSGFLPCKLIALLGEPQLALGL